MPGTAEGGRQTIEYSRSTDILVLHTDRTLLASLVDLLEMSGFAVATALLPERVQEPLTSSPRLAIAELTSTTRKLRVDPAWADVPFVFLTADAALADPRKLRKTGTDLILTEPFDYGDLLGAVEMLLGRSLYASARANLEWTHGLLMAADEAARVPLTHVYGYAHLLRDYHQAMDPAEVKHILDVILSGTEQVIQRADDLMLVTRLQSGLAQRDVDRYTASCPLRELVQEAANDVHESAERQGVSIWVDVPGDLAIRGVPFYLRHALARMLAAAISLAAVRGGGVLVGAQAGAGTVTVAIRVEGPGATADEIGRLFARLRSVDPAALDPEQWAGLGFGIAEALVRAHGGETRISAQPERTDFWISLLAAQG